MNQPRYGVLLVTGMHTHQENYGEDFAADPRCRIVAVSDEADVGDRRRKLNQRLAAEFKMPYLADLDDALARDDVQIVSICTEPDRRGRVALQCAKAGKHLYLDKALVPRLADADALVREAKERSLRTHMFSFHTRPWVEQARDFLESGKLGKLLAIHADAFFAKGINGTAKLGSHREEEYPPERQQLLEAKREWDNIGVYPITYIHTLTGKKFQSVYGTTANYFFAEHQKHNVEDFASLTGTLEDGTPVTISAGRYGWTTHPSYGRNHIWLIGSKRSVVIDAHHPRIEVYSDAPPFVPPKPHPEDPMGFWSSTQKESGVPPKRTWISVGPSGKSDASYFVDCLDAKRESAVSVVEAAHATEVILATYLSAKRGEAVRLPLER